MVTRVPDPNSLDRIEKASVDELRALQLERLKKTLQHTFDNVASFKARCDDKGVLPGDLKSLEDLALFPFTVKDDLRQSYPFGMFAVPQEQVVRIHASSGTTGKPTVVGYTQNDIDMWGPGCVARSIRGERAASRATKYMLLTAMASLPRPWRALWGGASWRDGHSNVRRADTETGATHSGHPARHHHGHAVVYAEYRR